MAFLFPSFSTLAAQMQADIQSAQFINGQLLPTDPLITLGMAVTKQNFYNYQFLRYVMKQCIPTTCDGANLDSWASLVGVTRYAATPATCTIQVTGTNGADVPEGSTFTRADNITYITQADTTISGTSVNVVAIATTNGSITNAPSGISVTLTSSATGLNTSATLATTATGGNDPETDTSLRNRMLAAFRAVGSGGTTTDWQNWIFSVPGVTRAWTLPWGSGPGTTLVYAMKDVVNASTNGFLVGSNGGSPADWRIRTVATGDQLAIANALYPALQPIGCLVNVATPNALHVPVSFAALSISPSTSVQASVLTALQALCVSVGTPLGATLYLSQVEAAIQTALGGSVTFTLSTPNTNITSPAGSLFTVVASDIIW